jgi:hypothetical protein
MRFGAWKISILYRTGSLTAAARELAKYKLDLVSVQEVSWDKGGTARAGIIIFSLVVKTKMINRKRIFLHHRIASAIKREEFVSDRMSYIVC